MGVTRNDGSFILPLLTGGTVPTHPPLMSRAELRKHITNLILPFFAPHSPSADIRDEDLALIVDRIENMYVHDHDPETDLRGNANEAAQTEKERENSDDGSTEAERGG